MNKTTEKNELIINRMKESYGVRLGVRKNGFEVDNREGDGGFKTKKPPIFQPVA